MAHGMTSFPRLSTNQSAPNLSIKGNLSSRQHVQLIQIFDTSKITIGTSSFIVLELGGTENYLIQILCELLKFLKISMFCFENAS